VGSLKVLRNEGLQFLRILTFLSYFSSVVGKRMFYFFACFVFSVAYSMGLEGLAFWWGIAGSGAFCSGYVFYLVSGHSFVEVGGLAE